MGRRSLRELVPPYIPLSHPVPPTLFLRALRVSAVHPLPLPLPRRCGFLSVQQRPIQLYVAPDHGVDRVILSGSLLTGAAQAAAE